MIKVAENQVAEKREQAIADNIAALQRQLAELTEQSQFTDNVTLLAVSKKHPVDAIIAAAESGLHQFAENYVQEGVDKIIALRESGYTQPLTWHFIGPLQSNKTAVVAEHFDWVQSIEREKIARRLNEQRPDDMEPLNVLLQVNIDDDTNKSGLAPEQVNPLAKYVSQCPNLKLRGLMTILQANTDETQRRQSFARMRQLYLELQQNYGAEIDTLSMGMSGDMRQAILEGANMVRIGTAIFGQRE